MAVMDKKTDRTARLLLIVFFVLSAGIILAGYLSYAAYAKHHRTEVERQLSAIADLKAAELQDWRRERIGDAQVFFGNETFSRVAGSYLENPADGRIKKEILSWISKYQAYYQYDRIMLLDARHRKRLVFPDRPEREHSFVSHASSGILKSGKIAFEDFYRNDYDKKIYLKILVPIREGKGSGKLIAVLAFRIDPDTYLYPYINSWPTTSRTAETLLVRREGNDVVFLNELRFQKNTALKLRFPLERRELPVVKAVLGERGVVEGRDYRSMPVIAAVRAVPDSPWYLSARMDLSEVEEPLRERLRLVMVLVGALILGAGASMGFIWRHQHSRFYREKYEASEALRESEERYCSLFENSLDAVFLTAPDGRILAANAAACEMLGRTEEEICRIGRDGVIDLSDPRLPAALEERARTGRFRGELTFVRKDGTTFSGEISTVIFRDEEGHERTSMIVRNITERLRAEDAVRRSEENFRRSLDESPLGVRIVTTEGETLYVNRALLDIYGYENMGELNSTSVADRYTPESYLDFQARRERRRKGFEESGEYLINVIRKDGDVRHLQVFRKGVLWNGESEYLVLYLDITDRKRAEEALRESEEQFRLLAEQSLMAIGIIQDGMFRYFNKAFEEINGYSADEIRGWRPLEFSGTIHPDDRDFVMDQIRKKQNGHPDVVSQYVFRIIHKNGDMRWIEIYSKTVMYKKRPADLITLIDVTERRKTEEALRERDVRFRKLAAWVPGMIYQFVRRPDGTYCVPFTSERIRDIFGCSPEDVREDFSPIAGVIWPGDFDKVIGSIEASAGHLTVWTCEYRVQVPGRPVRWVLGISTPEKLADGSILWHGFNTDITERKQMEDLLSKSEMEYRSLFENSLMGISEALPDGRLLRVNMAYARMYGYAGPDEMMREVTDVGRQLYSDPEDRQEVLRILSEKGYMGPRELLVARRDGSRITVLAAAREIRDISGNVICYQATHTDITERKRAEDELKRSYEQLRALAEQLQVIREESRIVIARELHDELGGGLTGLKMNLSLLSRTLEEEGTLRERGALMKRIQSAGQLIDDLIRNVRRIGMELRPSVLDDLGLIAALEWECAEFSARTGIQCDFVTALDDVDLEQATATAVFRVFQEALTNVSRHAGADRVTVLFGEEAGYFHLDVMDDGRGITEREILDIESLGILGMKERALVFGGELSIHGEPGRGTAVTLKIPRRDKTPTQA